MSTASLSVTIHIVHQFQFYLHSRLLSRGNNDLNGWKYLHIHLMPQFKFKIKIDGKIRIMSNSNVNFVTLYSFKSLLHCCSMD